MKDRIDRLYPQLAEKLRQTPLTKHPALGTLAGCQLWLKLENQQITGSFKLRGVLSKFWALEQEFGAISQVAAASTGNHAAAVCYAAQPYHCKPTLFVPKSITASKLEKLKNSNADIRIHGSHSGDSEIAAAQWALQQSIPLIHPYNDLDVIAGQGTIGLELMRQNPNLEMVFVPVGGGGLISGIASYLKEANPKIKIIGAQPINACEMALSIKENRIVPPSTKKTLSDGTAGGLDPHTITVDLCRRLVDDFVLVDEDEIVNAMVLLYDHANLMIEPAAALALAALLKTPREVAGRQCAAVICGGNVDPEHFKKIIGRKS